MISKILGGVSVVMLVLLSGMYYLYSDLQDENERLAAAKEQYKNALSDANSVIDRQEQDMETLQGILVKEEKRRAELSRQFESRSEVLRESVELNADFEQCWNMKLPQAYLDEIRD